MDDLLTFVQLGFHHITNLDAMDHILAQTLQLNAVTGEAIPLRFCGWKRSADLIFICMAGPTKRGIAGLKIRDAILADVFGDQVNVLQAEYGGQRHSVLFMGAAGFKALPAA